MQDQENITKVYDELQKAVDEMCLLPQCGDTSRRIMKTVNHINAAMLLLTPLRHDVFRKTGEWIEPVECLNGN